VRCSLIQNSITSEAKKNLYKGSVVRVSVSYRPSSKVVGCGEGSGEGAEGSGEGAVSPPQVKKIFFIYRFSSKG